ncbi:MAG: 3-hydroxyacyl-CoA dehydrogenase/enoyl-CoA hydratase family protein [Deltaproteobacteria bacterium]|nr:3-hydroxyacyl-CoA dehydrogenase/enoyl-CoA hydratase family protein [Deltaproteobacteria bacterium]
MEKNIKKAAVLGAGVMGATIAAHLANVSIPSIMLDIVPNKLSPEEEKKGLSLKDAAVRNRFAATGKQNLLRARPAALAVPEFASMIEVGNFADHLSRLAEVDWIIEVVIENLQIKQDLFKKVAAVRRPGTIVSSNTSGIPIADICKGMDLEFREHFLGTHFFNPPRYMKLLEIIPIPETLPEVVKFIAYFGERVLGKGIVYAKDTPNFIANRIGIFGMLNLMRIMVEEGYTIEEVDAITGQAMGRPKSAAFGTTDLVGLDTFAHVAKNLYENAANDEMREVFKVPDFVKKMIENNWLGNKTGQGFYKRIKSEAGKEKLVLDYKTMEYRPAQKVKLPSLDAVKAAVGAANKAKALIYAEDRAGQLAWKITRDSLLYTAGRIPEIADDIYNIDNAAKWGFNYEAGPFESWDAIGVEESVERMRKEGKVIPPLVEKLLAQKKKSFYLKKNGELFFFDLKTEDYKKVEEKPEVILLPSLKERNKLVKSNAGASLIDMGDGVACLEFHTYMNAIGQEIIEMILESLKIVEKDFLGMVIGNHAQNYSVGANLLMLVGEIVKSNWAGIEAAIKAFQDATMAMKYFEKPIVAAPHGMALGGGCEVCLASHRIRAALETYMGQVEIGVGLLPGAGGNKEVYLRCIEGIPDGVTPDLLPFLRKAFENIAMAKVATSAEEARKLGFLRSTDKITANVDHLLYDAKQTVLAMVKEGFRPPRPRLIPVAGDGGRAAIKYMANTMRQGGFISEYDEFIAGKLAYILTGGDVLSGALVTEQRMLDIEREAFLSLCGEKKTQDRISHMLKTNKPLRN